MSDKPSPTSGDTPPGSAARIPQAGEMTVTLDDSSVVPSYANFFRVTSTPEELVVDLGLNTATFGAGHANVKVTDRIVMSHYTAKRLLSGLTAAIQRHEQTFGPLETDVRKRVRKP